MSEPKHTITIRIRDLRRERALTQEELAEALGLSRQSINAMEAGRCLPSLPVALQIASYFSVPLSTVFALEEEIVAQLSQQIMEEQEQGMGLIPWTPPFLQQEPLFPSVNMWQTETDIWAEFRLPGYRTEDLSIEVGEDFLTVEGEESPFHGNVAHYIRHEFALRPFSRTISLPTQVHSEHAEAEMRMGILRIRIPKVEAPKPKTAKISIRSLE